MCFWSERKVTNETALRDYLCAFAATQLRGIARGMGVDSPTTKSKGELIDEIVEIAAGRKQPAEKSKRGAPVKGDAVDPTIFEKIKSFAGNYDIEQDRPNEVAVCIPHEQSAYEETILSGYALYGDDGFLLYTDGKTCIPISDCGGFDVRVGDKLMCAEKPNGSAAVLSVNGRIDFEERPRYEQRIAKYPVDCCYLGGSGRDWLRLVDLFSPIGKGQRALLTMSRSSDRRSVFIQIGKALCRNSDVTLIFLCLDAAPEEAEELKTEFPETDFFITEFGASAKEHVETAELAIERAKRLAELGQDAICLFDSLDVLSEACNALKRVIRHPLQDLRIAGARLHSIPDIVAADSADAFGIQSEIFGMFPVEFLFCRLHFPVCSGISDEQCGHIVPALLVNRVKHPEFRDIGIDEQLHPVAQEPGMDMVVFQGTAVQAETAVFEGGIFHGRLKRNPENRGMRDELPLLRRIGMKPDHSAVFPQQMIDAVQKSAPFRTDNPDALPGNIKRKTVIFQTFHRRLQTFRQFGSCTQCEAD